MAGLTIIDICEAVGAQLRATIGRETNFDIDGSGAPAPVIRLQLQPSDPIDYWVTFGSTGLSELRMELVVDPGNVDQSATRRLYDYLSVGTGNPSSIIDALMSDKTLGGVVETVHVSGVSEFDPIKVTATLPLQVVCRKSGAEV